MTAGIAEDVVEQPARSIDDGRLRDEARRGGNETEHGEHTLDAVEVAEREFQDGQRVQRAPSRGFCALLDGDTGAENTGVHELPVVMARELYRGTRATAVADDRVGRVWGLGRSRQREREGGGALADLPHPIAVI